MTTFTGDLLLAQLEDGSLDIFFENGQPHMTNGFETYVISAAYGEDCWINAIVRKESEKMKSKFPGIIRRNVVSDKTKNDGTAALNEAFAPVVTENIAKKVNVEGTIINANRIQWIVEFVALTDETLRFFINWEQGVLTAGAFSG
jgi:hypothetical protein